MTHFHRGDKSRLPVEVLAHRLLQDARMHPGLLARVGTAGAVMKAADGALLDQQAERFSPLSLLSDPTFDVRQYLEDLVSLAVSSAEQAETIGRQAREASQRMRRALVGVTTVAVLGLIFGIAGFSAERNAVSQLAAVNGQLQSLRDLQARPPAEPTVITTEPTQPRAGPLAEPTVVTTEPAQAQTDTTATRSVAETQLVAPQVAAPQVVEPLPAVPTPTPSVWRRPVPYSEPWPDRSVHHAAVTRSSRVVYPRFLASIGSWFR